MSLKLIGTAITVCILIGGWMVTGATAENNRRELVDARKDIKEAREERKEIRGWVIEQRTMNTSQYEINKSLKELLERGNV